MGSAQRRFDTQIAANAWILSSSDSDTPHKKAESYNRGVYNIRRRRLGRRAPSNHETRASTYLSDEQSFNSP
jgi:hypothetical protein